MDLLFDNDCIKLKKGYKCVLMGNSPKILDYKLGERIDQFDYVVRINDAPTENYEEKVGSKTDLTILNRTVQKESDVGNLTEREGILSKFESDVLLYPSTFVVEENAEEKLNNARNIYRISKEFREYKEAVEKQLEIEKMSTGLFSTIFLIHIYETITLLNFDFYTSKGSYHYWEDFNGGDTSCHNFEREKEFIKRLAGNGKIRYVSL